MEGNPPMGLSSRSLTVIGQLIIHGMRHPSANPDMGRKSHSSRGTTARLERQTSMRQHAISKQFNSARVNQARKTTVQTVSRSRLQRQTHSTEPTTPPNPARALLICLGWLRLYQRIILPHYAMVGRRGLWYER